MKRYVAQADVHIEDIIERLVQVTVLSMQEALFGSLKQENNQKVYVKIMKRKKKIPSNVVVLHKCKV